MSCGGGGHSGWVMMDGGMIEDACRAATKGKEAIDAALKRRGAAQSQPRTPRLAILRREWYTYSTRNEWNKI